MKRKKKKTLENIFSITLFILMILFFVFCFYIWAAGYDGIYQYFIANF